MVPVHTCVKREHVSKFNADTTITVLMMKSAPTKIKCATLFNAKVTPCAKKKHFQVKSTPRIVPLVNANVSNTHVKFLNAEPTNTVTPKLVSSVTPTRNLLQETHVSKLTVSVTICVTMMPDQNVKKADADVKNSNVSQSPVVTILTVPTVKFVLVNVPIKKTSMVPTSSTVKNQTLVSKLTAWVTMIAAKRNDVILTNVFQLNVEPKIIAVHRNSAEMETAKRLNAVTTPTAKVSSQIQIPHTNVNNKLVSLLNVPLPLIAVKVSSATKPPMSATNQSAWDMLVAKKLLVAKTVPAVVNSKRMLMVPTLVTNVSKLNAEPTITVQKQKNFATMKPTNVKELIAHHMIIVIKRMVTKNVLRTNASKLVALPMHIAVLWLSAKQTNASMFNARPMVTVHLDQSVKINNVQQ